MKTKLINHHEALQHFYYLKNNVNVNQDHKALLEVFEKYRLINKKCIFDKKYIKFYLETKKNLFFNHFLPILSAEARKILQENRDILNALLEKHPHSKESVAEIHFENLAEKINNLPKQLKIEILHALLTAYHPDTGINHCLKMKLTLMPLVKESIDINLEEYLEIAEACLIHDIGKLLCSRKFFLDNPNNPEKMAEATRKIFESDKFHHTLNGYYLLSIFDLTNFRDFSRLRLHALKHHYSYDNDKSYPFKTNINKNNFPLNIQILLILDVFNAMKESRAYKEATPKKVIENVLDELIANDISKDLEPLIIRLKEHLKN